MSWKRSTRAGAKRSQLRRSDLTLKKNALVAPQLVFKPWKLALTPAVNAITLGASDWELLVDPGGAAWAPHTGAMKIR